MQGSNRVNVSSAVKGSRRFSVPLTGKYRPWMGRMYLLSRATPIAVKRGAKRHRNLVRATESYRYHFITEHRHPRGVAHDGGLAGTAHPGKDKGPISPHQTTGVQQ